MTKSLIVRYTDFAISFSHLWWTEFPFPTVPPTLPPPRTKTKTVSEGRNVTFRCGQKIIHKKGKV